MKPLPPGAGTVFPQWLYDLPVFQGIKERILSGHPTQYPIYEWIAANGEQDYDIEVPENTIWVVDSLIHHDVMPGVFYLTFTVDDQSVISRQMLRLSLMSLPFPSPFPSTGGAYLKVENTDSHSALYQAVLRYRTFTRSSLNRMLELLQLEKL